MSVRNHGSALDHSHEVSCNIHAELGAGRIVQVPDDVVKGENVCISPGVQKKGSMKFRTINDLSFPRGNSINDSLTFRTKCKYESIDDAIAMVRSLGVGAFMAKLDIKDAFRLIPVHPHDRQFLGFKWLSMTFVDLRLPFGLRTSPPWFEALGRLLAWIIRYKLHVVSVVRYVDDFFVAAGSASECATFVSAIVKLFADIKVPVNVEKLISEGSPRQSCIFLGVELDSVARLARLDAIRLSAMREAVRAWISRDRWSVSELRELTGQLSFATKVIPIGRAFLRRLFASLCFANRESFSPIISDECKSDLQWWHHLLHSWNGVSMFLETAPPDWTIFSDASLTSWGVFCHGSWISQCWTHDELHLAMRASRVSLPFLELYALTSGVLSFAGLLKGKRVSVFCDCQPVVFALKNRSSKDSGIMALIRELCVICANLSIDIVPTHISGVLNRSADFLSRGQMEPFRALVPWADTSMTSPIRPSMTF